MMDTCREGFEKWFRETMMDDPRELDRTESYDWIGTDCDWGVWQAAWNAKPVASQGVVSREAIREAIDSTPYREHEPGVMGRSFESIIESIYALQLPAPAPEVPIPSVEWREKGIEILLHTLNMPDAGRKWAETAIDRLSKLRIEPEPGQINTGIAVFHIEPPKEVKHE